MYTKTTWNAGVAPGISAANLNNLETQYEEVEAILTTRGDTFFRNATVLARLAAGTTGRGYKQGANDPEWTGVFPTIVLKASDETVNNSNALQNDDDLLFAIGANEDWIFQFSIFYDSTAYFKFAITVPAAGTFLIWGVGQAYYSSGAFVYASAITASGTSRAVQGGGAGTAKHTIITGSVSNGANAGNVQLQWAQSTAEATDTKVLAGSSLTTWEVV